MGRYAKCGGADLIQVKTRISNVFVRAKEIGQVKY
jgi:hypothetical protein